MMHNKAWVWALFGVVFVVGTAIAGIFLLRPTHDQVLPSSTTPTSGFSVTSFSRARRMQNYIQPPEELIQSISRVYSSEMQSDEKIPESSKGSALILINGVPFFPYWQKKEKQYAFHPMAYGGFLSRLSCTEPIDRYLDAAEQMAYKLPNGGLLWYYPDNYNLNRFLGPDISPSAIGQGQILGAIVDLDRRCDRDLYNLARSAFLGLAFPYYDGGVNLKDKFLLELPLFRSAPEVILNGWLHALLYLRQYADYYNDSQARKLFLASVATLAQDLPSFHDAKTGLSLYSDLCPYRVRIRHPNGPLKKLFVFYKAREAGLDNLVFELKPIMNDRSSYDNRVIKSTKSFTDVWISCSQRYDTYLVAEGAPFTAEFTTGTYDPKRATPAAGGEHIELQSHKAGDYEVVHITSVRQKLFCGYPTNFSKYVGKNYYHVYHVVALACLLASADLPQDVRDALSFWMHKWMKTIENWDASEGLEFYSYQYLLDDLYEHKACLLTDDWETLLRKAEERGQNVGIGTPY